MHCAHCRILIEVPSIKRASGNAGMQMVGQGEFNRGKANGSLPSMEGGTQEKEDDTPPQSTQRIIAGIICVPNYWVIRSPSKNTRSKTPTTHASTPTTPGCRQLPRLKPKPKLTWRNPRAMQKHRVNKLATSDFSKQALKRATLWFAHKSKKKMVYLRAR